MPSCPVTGDACRLAARFLAVLRADVGALGDSATKQNLACPTDTPTADEIVGAALAAVCRGRPPAASVEVYEFHTGKGPLYFLEPVAYASAVSRALEGLGEAFRVIAAGCGISDPASKPDCGKAAVAVYSIGDAPTPSLPSLALIFTRASEAEAWKIEKVWTPFPGVVSIPVPPGLRVEINSAGGVRAVELYPYDVE